jgi:hypothetical protein
MKRIISLRCLHFKTNICLHHYKLTCFIPLPGLLSDVLPTPVCFLSNPSRGLESSARNSTTFNFAGSIVELIFLYSFTFLTTKTSQHNILQHTQKARANFANGGRDALVWQRMR